MRGTVSPPTVFLENAHLAQRHINAFLFAETSRQNRNELGDYARKQEIPISLVIPPGMRATIPNAWWLKDTKQRFVDLKENWALAASDTATPHPHLDPLARAFGG